MLKETKTENQYTCIDIDTGTTILTINKNEDIYTIKTLEFMIVAEVKVIDDYKTSVTMLTHKRKGKDGKFRKTTKLIQHNMRWCDYILEETGFIRKAKCVA